MTGPRRVALVHDYLADLRGGERVFYEIARVYPEADLFSLVFEPSAMGEMGDYFAARGVRTSFVQWIPGASRHFQSFVPLYPLATRRLDLTGYDLVISSSSAWVHAVRVDPGAIHVCYCHAPFRYAWSHFPDGPGHGPALTLARPFLRWVRRADVAAASRVTQYVANSEVTRARILAAYGRDSVVVHPPVDVEKFRVGTGAGDYLLVVASLIPYKRVDLAVAACSRLGLELKVVGTGPELRRLRSMAGPSVSFLGRVGEAELSGIYSGCRAVLFPQEEDFGLVPLEAMASGRPMVAFARGGALETVVDGVTGILFAEQTEEALADALARLREASFDPAAIRRHAEGFSVGRFVDRFSAVVSVARFGG